MPYPKQYMIGWICATVADFVAAQTLLDQEHERPEYVSQHDNNGYAFGSIKDHNVVIAVFPDGEYGTSSAAMVARDMLHSFPDIRIGLMVGVAGGAPSPRHDIRLGDVVVSSPRDGIGGVFQYDFGKTIQEQKFQSGGFLNQPPTVLRTAVNGLETKYKMAGHQIEQTIQGALKRNPRLRNNYSRPDASKDKLYRANVIHSDKACCATATGDERPKLVRRPPRTKDDDNPAVHHGLIASANTVMQDALFRDQLSNEKDVLCFETEAAGLMNHFPCLVIRGICYYSDTHKHEEWQGYAAMTAAAYAKDLLCLIAPNKVGAEGKIAEAFNDETNTGLETFKRAKLRHWLSPPGPSTYVNKALEQGRQGSGQLLLQNEAYSSKHPAPRK
ncbi:hypothetical protein VMCG_00790 [Cytospora schulzeri]|uniref:Nucleoside phosphorylase domain-containing protein n=1 Tax=Cytospora schulzeri TaxID=448051 RepID=A0A423X8S2_9PEZI|nr:hypothetical protein VMCG_00790 [Valsa malicola]